MATVRYEKATRVYPGTDHPEGGLGSAVIDSLIENGITDLRVTHLAVRGMPGSGTTEELLAWAGIDAEHIADAACN